MAYCEICGYEGSMDNKLEFDGDRFYHSYCLELEEMEEDED